MKAVLLLPFAAAALMLGGCEENLGKGPMLHVAGGEIVMGATPDRPAAGYFRVEAGTQDVQLVAVTADLAQRVEMHESVKEGGMMTMRPIVGAAVPARGKMEFKKGGKHLMVWGVNPAAVRAGKLPMVFIFSNNMRIMMDLDIETPVAGATETPPVAGAADEAHKGH